MSVGSGVATLCCGCLVGMFEGKRVKGVSVGDDADGSVVVMTTGSIETG